MPAFTRPRLGLSTFPWLFLSHPLSLPRDRFITNNSVLIQPRAGLAGTVSDRLDSIQYIYHSAESYLSRSLRLRYFRDPSEATPIHQCTYKASKALFGTLKCS